MMRLPPFRWLAPRSMDEALRWKAEAGPESAYVAGGTDLYPNMKRRHQTPHTLIALRHVPELRGIRAGAPQGHRGSTGGERGGRRGDTAGRVRRAALGHDGAPGGGDGWARIGAGEVLNDVATHPGIRVRYPALAHAVESISTPILRNMGTIGGNCLLDTRCTYYNQNADWRASVDFCMKREGTICWVAPASPRCWAVQSADSVPVLVAIGADMTLVSGRGERRIPAADLYRDDGIDYLTKGPDELLTAIHLPPADGWRATYRKLRRRGAFDFPVLGVAAWARFAGDGTVAEARVVLGGVGSHPIRVEGAGRALAGSRLEPDAIRAAADVCFRAARPLDNTDFTLSWRKEMVRPFVRRTLQDLGT